MCLRQSRRFDRFRAISLFSVACQSPCLSSREQCDAPLKQPQVTRETRVEISHHPFFTSLFISRCVRRNSFCDETRPSAGPLAFVSPGNNLAVPLVSGQCPSLRRVQNSRTRAVSTIKLFPDSRDRENVYHASLYTACRHPEHNVARCWFTSNMQIRRHLLVVY